MDRDFEVVNKKMKTLEMQMTLMEFRVFKDITLIEVEQVLEVQRNKMKLSEIDSKIQICEMKNENAAERVCKLQDEINVMNTEISTLKELVINMQNMQCKCTRHALDIYSEQQTESESAVEIKEYLIDDSSKSVFEKEFEEDTYHLKLENPLVEDSMEITENIIIDDGVKQVFEKETEEDTCHLKFENSLVEDGSSRNDQENTEFNQVEQIASQLEVLNAVPDFAYVIPDVVHQISRGIADSSPSFPVSGFPLSAQAYFSFERNSYFFSIFLMPRAKEEEHLLANLVMPGVHLVLKDRSGNRHLDLVRSGSFGLGAILKTIRFSFNASAIVNRSYLARDAIAMEIHVEPPSVANRVHSRNGTMIWTIRNYQECGELEAKGLRLFQLSPYFYTASRGFRVQAAAYLNGEGLSKGHGLSVRISFLTGEFDQELSSFFHRTTITIGDRSDLERASPSITEIHEVGKRQSTSYVINLWDNRLVETFLVDDSLTLKIVIKAQ